MYIVPIKPCCASYIILYMCNSKSLVIILFDPEESVHMFMHYGIKGIIVWSGINKRGTCVIDSKERRNQDG